jgi:hypothetical protein
MSFSTFSNDRVDSPARSSNAAYPRDTSRSRGLQELDIEGVLETQQGSGTFISPKKPQVDELDRVPR